MAAPQKLERYGGSKVRTGCVTCKARRVKCDETKPSCLRCSKAGRLCGGYATPPKNRFAAGRPLVIISYVAPGSSISPLPEVGLLEKRSLEFFRTYTALQTFPSPEFQWSEDLLRTSCYEKSVRHGVVALAAVHEHFIKGTGPMDSEFAMQQYSKAMKQVMRLDMQNSTSTDVALISCILFACFESLQGHFLSSILHVNSGIQILKEQENANVAETKVAYISKKLLRPMYLRFVTQSREIGDNAMTVNYYQLPATAPSPIPSLMSFEEAHRSMTTYLHDLSVFLNALDPTLQLESCEIQDIVNTHAALKARHIAWCNAFDALLERGPIPSASDVAQLQLSRTLIDLFVDLVITLEKTEMLWDVKTDHFRKMLDFAEIVVNEQPKGPSMASSTKTTSTWLSGPRIPGMGPIDQYEDSLHSIHTSLPFSEVDYCQMFTTCKPVFSIDIGIVPPLYVVVSRCRDPAIRRRGLRLLASCNRREGIWDSNLCARVAERIIAIEESGAISHPVLCASQIPEHARIRELTPKFGVDSEGVLKFVKSVPCVGPNDKYEELLEW